MPTEKTRKKRIPPTQEEKELFKQFREKQLREKLPYKEYTKAVKKYYKQKHKLDRKEYDKKRYDENKETLNKERVERARIQRETERERQFAQNMIEFSEALGPNNMNAGPDPSQEYNANSSLPNNMNPGPVAFDYIPYYEEDANSSFYDGHFSDIEEEPIVESEKRYRSESPVSENKRANVLNEKDLDLDKINMDDLKAFDVDGGRKTRKRRNRKTKKNKKRH